MIGFFTKYCVTLCSEIQFPFTADVIRRSPREQSSLAGGYSTIPDGNSNGISWRGGGGGGGGNGWCLAHNQGSGIQRYCTTCPDEAYVPKCFPDKPTVSELDIAQSLCSADDKASFSSSSYSKCCLSAGMDAYYSLVGAVVVRFSRLAKTATSIFGRWCDSKSLRC